MDNQNKIKVVCIVGPTGVGKSALSIYLANHMNGEIISGDSMQVYKKMDIGTAKITEEEMEGIPHYCLDIIDYSIPFNVKSFQSEFRKSVQQIHDKGKMVISCGGTGLYLKAALYDYEFDEEVEDPKYTAFLNEKSNEELVAMLQIQDPQALNKIHPNNRKRLLRALQAAHLGRNKSQRENQQSHQPIYDVFFIGLNTDREIVKKRIDERVEKMFDDGLVLEAEELFSNPDTWNYTSFLGIGYKEFKPYFLKEASLEDVKEAIKVHSRQYARRQMTWFNNQMPIRWYDYNNYEEILKDVKNWYDGNE